MLCCSAVLFVRFEQCDSFFCEFQQSDFVSRYVHSIVLLLLLSLDASAKNRVQTFLYSADEPAFVTVVVPFDPVASWSEMPVAGSDTSILWHYLILLTEISQTKIREGLSRRG
jgi:hypothetical protein